jgi:hypothetical protein
VLSLEYYSKMRMLYNLVPLLTKVRESRVVSVEMSEFSAQPLSRDDLSLRKHYWGARHVFQVSHVKHMMAFFFEEIVEKHPSIACVQVHPNSAAKVDTSKLAKVASWLIGRVPLFQYSERSLYHNTWTKYTAIIDSCMTSEPAFATGTDGYPGSGAYAVDWKGDSLTQMTKWMEKR